MIANEHQVGGKHYKVSYEHWDMCLRCGLSYLEGQATKYVVRWRKKNGVDDLRKALHYVDKLIENAYLVLLQRSRAGTYPEQSLMAEVNSFVQANALTPNEESVVRLLVFWRAAPQLEQVHDLIVDMIELVERDQSEPKPVPLSDSNKHGERATKE